MLRSGLIVRYAFPHPSDTLPQRSIMSAVRITKRQVEAAGTARGQALEEDPEFRRFDEEHAKQRQGKDEEEKNPKESG